MVTIMYLPFQITEVKPDIKILHLVKFYEEMPCNRNLGIFFYECYYLPEYCIKASFVFSVP